MLIVFPIHFITFPHTCFLYTCYVNSSSASLFLAKSLSLFLALSLKARSSLIYPYPSPFPIPTSQNGWVIFRSGCNACIRKMPLLGCLLAHLALWLVSSQLSRQQNRLCVGKDQTQWLIGVEWLGERCSRTLPVS